MTDPAKDTLRSFVAFVNSYTDRFFAGSSLRLRFEFPEELPAMVLPAETRRSLLMVIKEALSNVAKHAEASELHIKLEIKDRKLHMTFKDDGRGFFKSDNRSGGHGLANMHQRVRELGGNIEIESVPGGGTGVSVWAPLPKR